ncbi:glucose PTS transporter subunit IIA [Lactobacillus sp. ESL0731]|uniref:glucose PTS transporter subunit IIA n=1 Tax=unclassified Lactobacillus TaxID=2620435 RepID=UPI0023F75899|nr:MULTISPECIES: glucose PTS transporter subunit IIA [unclassified Lactobacillus]WEV50821.1 glucose PTS transporter subunit IIA [Lactobacillus sp. ESL0700]WEV61952.1 glucose PTS transporter subunit IIA [Lactobacillus sp. ESL0731]
MSSDKYTEMGKEIYAHIGGIRNVATLYHCMTRIRISIREMSKVDIEGLKKIDGVLGVVESETLEIVLGPGVNTKVAQSMVDAAGVKENDPFPENGAASGSSYEQDKNDVMAKANEVHAAHKASLKKTWWRAALQHISAIFIPLIPAFVGAGLISGLSGIMKNMLMAKMLPVSWTLAITVLGVLSSGLFTYLNIFVGINAAKEFGATPGLGGIIGGIVMLPGVVPPVTIPNIFDKQPLAAGQGGIIGVLLSVWLLSYVEKYFHRHIADSVDIIFTPFLTLLIMGLFTIFITMPIAGWVSNSLVGGINWVLAVGGPIAGFILGLAFLPMVMLGLHQILTPIHLQMIQKMGYTPLLPILAMAGGGQVGAAIALWVKCRKNKQLTKLIKGALPVGILGVGEPLIYGVSLPLGRPFITACIGGGIGGAVLGAFGNVGSKAIGTSGIALIPLIANNKYLLYILGLLAAYLGGFVATYFFGVPKTAMVAKNEDGSPVEPVKAAPVVRPSQSKSATVNFVSPVSGELEELTAVNDDVFSQKMVGDGYAVIPEDGKIVAPVDGTIVTVMATKHAITMTSTNGNLEILLHFGIDTVDLKGAPFDIKVKEGQTVKRGTVLAQMDIAAIKEAGKDPVVMTIVTNMDQVKQMSAVVPGKVSAEQNVITVRTK